MVQSFLID